MARKSDSSAGSVSSVACNRVPFYSGDGCDRGDVDITQFDDLPYCDPIDPTKPAVPPEVIDSPFMLPVPPPCSCININHKFDLKYGGDFNATATFKSNGDCCNGNYIANFDLQLACPIKSSDPKKITIGIGYGNGENKLTKDYISQNAKACSINPISPEFDLYIPCPVKIDGQRKIAVGISYGNGEKYKEVAYVNARGDKNCSLNLSNATLNLNIPCPIKGSSQSRLTIGVEYGNGQNKLQKPYVSKDTANCSISTLEPEFNLNIPCPIKVSGKKNFTIKLNYGPDGNEKKIPYMEQIAGKDCKITPLEPEFDLKIPCPIKETGEKKISIEIGYGNGDRKKRLSYVQMDSKTCEIKPKDTEFVLKIPCPIKATGDKKITVGVSYGSGESRKQLTYVSQNNESCSITPRDAEFNIQIPCPVGSDKLKVTPSILPSIDTDEKGEFKVENVYKEKCGREIKLKIRFPKSGMNLVSGSCSSILFYKRTDGKTAMDIFYV